MKDIKKRLFEAINQYIEEEESLGDAVRLAISPSADVIRLEADPDTDDPAFDYYDIVDLLIMNTDGSSAPDSEAVEEVLAEYGE